MHNADDETYVKDSLGISDMFRKLERNCRQVCI